MMTAEPTTNLSCLRFMDLPLQSTEHYSTNAVVHWPGEALSDVRPAGVRELETRLQYPRGVRKNTDSRSSTRQYYLKLNRKAASRYICGVAALQASRHYAPPM